MRWWEVLLAAFGGLALAYAAALVALRRVAPDEARLREALRLLPDVARLVRRLAADRDVPRGVRIRLLLLVAYLASPIDLVPDVVPVLGYADDAIVISLVLRSVIRRAGVATIRRHWVGTSDGLAALGRVTGMQLSSSGAPSDRPSRQTQDRLG